MTAAGWLYGPLVPLLTDLNATFARILAGDEIHGRARDDLARVMRGLERFAAHLGDMVDGTDDEKETC